MGLIKKVGLCPQSSTFFYKTHGTLILYTKETNEYQRVAPKIIFLHITITGGKVVVQS